MWIRLRLDVSPRDLARGMWGCCLPFGRVALQEQAERHWSRSDQGVSNEGVANQAVANQAVAVLSVRSGLDLLLSAQRFPCGSEVLMSALTVPDMVRIVEHHGLVPVPVDLVEDGCTLSLESLRRGVTPATRMLVVAHLFGTRIEMAPILEFSRQHDLFVIEDCAQIYDGNSYREHEDSDASLFSFGPIKTATALGGGVIRLRSPELADRIRKIQSSYCVQSRLAYFGRLLKYSALKALATRPCFSVIAGLCRAMHIDLDTVVAGAARNFPAENLFEHLRRQPSAPLLRLLIARWRHFDAARLQQRVRNGQWFAEQLGAAFLLDQRQAMWNNYWVFPILVDDQQEVVQWMRRHGFDASGRTRLSVVPPPADRSELEPVNLRRTLQQMVFLPWSADIPPRLLQQMARLLHERVESSGPEHGANFAPAVESIPPQTVKEHCL